MRSSWVDINKDPEMRHKVAAEKRREKTEERRTNTVESLQQSYQAPGIACLETVVTHVELPDEIGFQTEPPVVVIQQLTPIEDIDIQGQNLQIVATVISHAHLPLIIGNPGTAHTY
jgi:hypothetical protein